MQTLRMFPPVRPRAKPRVMADVIDAGWQVIRIRCKRCEFSDWIHSKGHWVLRKFPCPKCNEVNP